MLNLKFQFASQPLSLNKNHCILSQLGGLLYKANLLWVKRWAVIPRPVFSLLSTVLSPVLDVSAPKIPSTYGATLELQRIEEEDRLEQAMLMASMQHHRLRHNNRNQVLLQLVLSSQSTSILLYFAVQLMRCAHRKATDVLSEQSSSCETPLLL